MTNETQTSQGRNAPVERINDGSVNAKIWRNVSNEGKPFYNVTFARTYTHPKTGQPAETQTFSGTDVLKVQRLAEEAYQSVDRLKKQDRTQNRDQTHGQDQQQAQAQNNGQLNLSVQRDQAMNNAAQNQSKPQHQDQSHQNHQGPEMDR